MSNSTSLLPWLVVLPVVAFLVGWLLGRRRVHALEVELAQARAVSPPPASVPPTRIPKESGIATAQPATAMAALTPMIASLLDPRTFRRSPRKGYPIRTPRKTARA